MLTNSHTDNHKFKHTHKYTHTVSYRHTRQIKTHIQIIQKQTNENKKTQQRGTNIHKHTCTDTYTDPHPGGYNVAMVSAPGPKILVQFLQQMSKRCSDWGKHIRDGSAWVPHPEP